MDQRVEIANEGIGSMNLTGRKLRSDDIEDMIQSRLEERSWAVEQMPASDGLWPEAFCQGE
ncbi:MAG: hypothetical protein WB392_03520 [Methanotrichaceae archaeon]